MDSENVLYLTPEEHEKQEAYRDARFLKKYDDIWKSVGKCVFCDLKDKYIFFEEHGVVMTISLFAYIDGHFMIVPRRHVRSPKELTQLEWDTVRKFSYIAKKLIKDVHHVKGMQIVQKDGATAQSTVDQHLHFHCIPFDAPDLTVWNFRKLQYTPLQNVKLYKNEGKKIVELNKKYDSKYAQPSGMRIVCDALIINRNNQVLLQERKKELRLTPNYFTLPGGGVDNYTTSLEEELAREVAEETSIVVDRSKLTLIDSRFGKTKITRYDSHLKAEYKTNNHFMWNTYLYKDVDPEITLLPGDDCEALIWMDTKEAFTNDRISPEVRDVLRKALNG